MGYDFNKFAETSKKVSLHLTNSGYKSSIKTSRYQTEIKAVEVSTPLSLEELFKTIGMEVKISDLSPVQEKAISGKYKAKLVKLTKSFFALASGESFFIVNTHTEKGVLKTKDLAPDKFNLTTVRFDKLDTFDNAVYKGIKENSGLNLEIKNTLIELYKSVASNKMTKDNITLSDEAQKYFAKIKVQDRQAIGKDFGEILSMRWYVTQNFAKNFDQFYFSEVSNEALVDFVVTKRVGQKIVPSNVSAKFEAGAAPSIGAIVGNIDKIYKIPTPEEKKAITVLKSLASKDSNTSTKILDAIKTVELPAYYELKDVIKKPNFTITDISANIQSIANKYKDPKDRINEFNRTYKDFYTVLGKTASSDSLSVVFNAASYKKYYSLVLGPSGYALVDYMNKQKIYQDILNNISQSMSTEQVYLHFVGNNLMFRKKLFSQANFKFAYGANAKDSDNTGIKFSMTQ